MIREIVEVVGGRKQYRYVYDGLLPAAIGGLVYVVGYPLVDGKVPQIFTQ